MKQFSFNTKRVLQILQEELGANVKLAQWLMDRLEISKSSAYERINGKSELNVHELITILCNSPRTFQRSTELLVDLPLRVFELNQFHNAEEAHQYLLRIETLFKEACRHADFQLRYVALDLPVFYFFSDPLLFTYKISTWSGESRQKGLCKPLPETLQCAQRLWEAYLSMPTQELWYPQAWEKQWRMVAHDLQHGFLQEEEAQHLEKVYQSLLAQFKAAATSGIKKGGGHLEAYSTLHFSLNNCGLLHYNNMGVMLGTVHNAQHFDSTCQNSLQLFDKLWARHLETADSLRYQSTKWLNEHFALPLNSPVPFRQIQ